MADQNGVVYVTGWNAGSFDSLMVLQLPADSGQWTLWAEMFGEQAATQPLTSGGLAFSIFTTQQSASLYEIPSPGKARRLGAVPRPVDAFFVSRDGRHASVGVRDYHGDAWMSQVVRP